VRNSRSAQLRFGVRTSAGDAEHLIGWKDSAAVVGYTEQGSVAFHESHFEGDRS